MPDEPTDHEQLIPITEVERQTGIRQATLRMWEKRYNFPQPLRDRNGDRVYPASQVERLHTACRLINQGHRPGKIFSHEFASGPALAPVQGKDAALSSEFEHVFALLREYRLAQLHGHFQNLLLEMGLRRFIVDFLGPLTTQVGLAWARGELPIRFEHLYAQLVQSILHAHQSAVRSARFGRPKIVLATLPGEKHVLGILMAEAVMASFGLECIQLGTETPAPELAAAAQESGVDVVALSFSGHVARAALRRAVAGLQTQLPPATSIWIGGDGARNARLPETGIEIFDSLEHIEPILAQWRLQLNT
jgi:MerR family transcriptional regulator, light-induced transcriptional regulator